MRRGRRRCLQLKLFGELYLSQGLWNRPLHFAGLSSGQNPLIPALGTQLADLAPCSCVCWLEAVCRTRTYVSSTVRCGSLDAQACEWYPVECDSPAASCLFLSALPPINLATPLPSFPLSFFRGADAFGWHQQHTAYSSPWSLGVWTTKMTHRSPERLSSWFFGG